MIEVELPDGTVIEFPDGTSRDVMLRAIASFQAQNRWQQARDGTLPQPSDERLQQQAEIDRMHGPQDQRSALYRNIFGGSPPDQLTPGEKLGTLLNMGGESLSFGLVGDEANAAFDSMIGRGSYDDRLAHHRASEAQMEADHPLLSLGARLAPAAIPASAAMRGILAAPTTAGRIGRGAGVGAGLSGLYAFMEGEGGLENRAAQVPGAAAIGGVLGGAIPAVGGLLSSRAQTAAQRRAAKDVPSATDLRRQAGELYEAAQAAGRTATREQTTSLAGEIRRVAASEGLITPRGRILESYPKLRDVLNTLDDFADGTMTPRQMQAVRRTLSDAAGSADKGERRIGNIMLKSFDDFVDTLAPEFRQANALYARAMRGGVIDDAISRAENRASQFSGSGFENALRSEFRALNKRIIDGKLRGLTKEQIAAIRNVAEGGPLANILRHAGKAAPTGIVSAGLGAGVPFAIGHAIGGPGLGAAMGATSMALGGLARRGATNIARSKADLTNATMRSATGSLPVPQASGPGLLAPFLLGATPETANRQSQTVR